MEKTKKNKHKYKNFWQAVGKRKTSTARVRMTTDNSDQGIIINGKPLQDYFKFIIWQKKVTAPLSLTDENGKWHISIKVAGGGPNSQAEAIRHGISRCLLAINPDYRKVLKAAGFVMRDPRVKERKKPGLKRARRAPQWQKR